MSEQLGINPEMDALARENGLGHWNCTDPIGIRTWLRSDGIIRCPLSDGDISTDAYTVSFVFNRLILCDKINAVIGKDWQQPRKDLIAELNKPMRTEEINGVTLEYDLFGGVNIKIEDFVYVHINYDHRYTHNAARKKLAERIAMLINEF